MANNLQTGGKAIDVRPRDRALVTLDIIDDIKSGRADATPSGWQHQLNDLRIAEPIGFPSQIIDPQAGRDHHHRPCRRPELKTTHEEGKP